MNKKPDKLALAAFVAIVAFLGVNFVAVKFSNRELPPFWGASLRFIIASVLLFTVIKAKNISLPEGKALLGAALYGLFGFGITYGLLYWVLTVVSAGMASIMLATIPLITLLIASLIGLEKLSWRAVLGAIIVMSGIIVVFYEQLTLDIQLIFLIGVLLAALSGALSGIVVKYFPRSHPISINAVGMAVGALALFLMSLIAGETFRLPSLIPTWLALGWLITSSIVAFVLMVWLIAQWNASKASYTTVLFPLITVVTASLLAGETISLPFLTGGLLALLGVYVGVLSSKA